MADTQVLGTCVFGRVGSSPTSRTMQSIRWTKEPSVGFSKVSWSKEP